MAHHPPFASSTTTGSATSSSLASRIALSSLSQGPASMALAFASASASALLTPPLALSPSSGQKRKLSQTVSANNIIVTSSSLASASSVRLSSSSSSVLRRRATATAPAMVSTPNMMITKPAGSSSALPVSCSGFNATTPIPLSPAEYWKSLLKEWKIPILDSVGIDNDMAAEGDGNDNYDDEIQFLETTPDRIDAYQNNDLLTAVRRRDLDKLRKIGAAFSAAGKTMNACNRFGESILHLACRKCSTDVVQFLIDDEPAGMGCSLLVRDDYGRTVLHDACWTISPPWILLKLILKKSPILWRVSDVRGHLALQYVPKSAWSKWISFIQENQLILKQIMISSYYKKKESSTGEQDDTMGIPQQQVPQQQDSTMMDTTSSHPQAEGITSFAAANAAVNNPKIVVAAAATARPASVSRAITPQSSMKQVVAGPIGSQDEQIRQLEAQFAIQAARSALALASGGGIAKTSEAQATAVLAKALAQANPEMMLALSISQPRAQKQGVQQIPSRQQQASYSTVFQQAPATSVRATGPATAALAAALQRPQFSGHGNRRSTKLQSSKDSSSSLTQSELRKQPSKSPKQCIPYAPSISMIAARLAGYQRATTARELLQQANIHTGEANGHPIEAISSDATSACAAAISQQGQDQATARKTTTTMEYVVGNVPNPLRQQKQLEDHDQEEERMEVQQQQQLEAANNNNRNINNSSNNIDSNIPNPTNNTNSTTSRILLSSIPPTTSSRSSSSTTLTDFGSNNGDDTTTNTGADVTTADDVPNPLRGQQQEEVDQAITTTTANASVCSPLSSTTTTTQKKNDVDSDDTAPCSNATAAAAAADVATITTQQPKLEETTSSSSFNSNKQRFISGIKKEIVG